MEAETCTCLHERVSRVSPTKYTSLFRAILTAYPPKRATTPATDPIDAFRIVVCLASSAAISSGDRGTTEVVELVVLVVEDDVVLVVDVDVLVVLVVLDVVELVEELDVLLVVVLRELVVERRLVVEEFEGVGANEGHSAPPIGTFLHEVGMFPLHEYKPGLLPAVLYIQHILTLLESLPSRFPAI
ncbi:hypothetical protein HDU93_002910 [Gonapodya sp. JEL0774]|nr:hypothetical protein HDU93_002910 [Gonapodya sp. JEL0774]